LTVHPSHFMKSGLARSFALSVAGHAVLGAVAARTLVASGPMATWSEPRVVSVSLWHPETTPPEPEAPPPGNEKPVARPTLAPSPDVEVRHLRMQSVRTNPGELPAIDAVAEIPMSPGCAGMTWVLGAPEKPTASEVLPGSGPGGRCGPPSPMGDNHPPSYPEAARRAGAQGTVWLALELDEDGAVIAVRQTVSSGHAALDEAAAAAARSWRFEPATLDGVPTASCVSVPVRFGLAEPFVLNKDDGNAKIFGFSHNNGGMQ